MLLLFVFAWFAAVVSVGFSLSWHCPVGKTIFSFFVQTLGHRFVTLNPHKPVPPSAVMGQWVMAHPVLDHIAVVSQELLPSIQGKYRCVSTTSALLAGVRIYYAAQYICVVITFSRVSRPQDVLCRGLDQVWVS